LADGKYSASLARPHPLKAQGEESVSAETTQNPSGRIFRIDAKPEPIAIDITKTAIIVVDTQNDFGAKGVYGREVSLIKPNRFVQKPARA